MELREPMSEEPADFDPFASGPLAAWAPTTDPQREILSSALVASDASAAFNQTLNIRLAGRLDVAALYRALTALAMRHDALRASIAADGLSLVIADVVLVPIEEEDLTTDPAAAAERLRNAEAEEVTVPLDLLHGPLIRARLCRLGDELHHLLVTIHHVVCDGWSIGIIYRDLAELYAAEIEQRPAQLAPAPSFVEYALARGNDRDSGAFDEALRYWLETYRELPTVLELPYDKPRPAMRTFAAATITGRTDNGTAAKLKRLGAANSTTLLATLYASFQAFVARITGIDDVVVGIFSAGQMQHGMPGLVGHCVNMLPVRTSFQPDAPFGDLARAVHGTLLDAQDYQQCTFGTLINHLAIRRDASRVPLSPIVFNLDRAAPPLSFGNVAASMAQVARDRETFEWFVNVVEQPEGLHLEWTYNTDLFSREAMQHLLDCYLAFLESIAGNGGSAVSDVAVITREHEERLSARAGAADPRLVEGSFLEWVREHSEREPTRCAVEDEAGQSITYGELWSRAGRIAASLVRDGIADTDVVGVMLERSALLPAVLLGVLRSGAAYLPLDPDFPAGRLSYMVEDSGAALVITDQAEPVLGDVRLVSPQSIESATDDAASSALPCSDALAYVLYTSGSTGQPKGVEITHGALRNFLGSMLHEPGLSRDDVLFAVTTLSFDISGLELYLPLCAGARVVIASKETASDGYALADVLETSGATSMQATPATWRMLADSGWSGRLNRILCGGEALPEELARVLVTHADEVWNLYGPTETTIWSTAERIDGEGPVTVGHPIANTRIHVLDTRGGLVPDGVHGEIWIGGSGVARGYRNRADLTAERFRDDPFDPGERMYRTGDMGRWRTDGRLEHLGRLDFQVKVNGFRIELGEVESAFETLAEIRQAVVMARGTTDERRLVAYVVFEDGKSLLSSEVRRRLGDRLPQYMVPGVVVALDRLPLTPNGKVDRKALPDPFEASAAIVRPAHEEPEGVTEQAIADVWRELLGVERVSRHDNFFELGGHSLLAVQAAARLAGRTGIELNPRELVFRNVMQLAGLGGATLSVAVDEVPVSDTASDVDAESAAASPEGLSRFVGRIGRVIQRRR